MAREINVTDEFDDAQQVADALERIAELIRQGYTSGYEPAWNMTGVEDAPLCGNCGDGCRVTQWCEGCDETICDHCWREHNKDAADHCAEAVNA